MTEEKTVEFWGLQDKAKEYLEYLRKNASIFLAQCKQTRTVTGTPVYKVLPLRFGEEMAFMIQQEVDGSTFWAIFDSKGDLMFTSRDLL